MFNTCIMSASCHEPTPGPNTKQAKWLIDCFNVYYPILSLSFPFLLSVRRDRTTIL